jgi:hypothetical protein
MRAGLAMGLRLGAGGRRGALPQIVLTAVGVAVGVTLVLLTLTVLPAMEGHRLAGVVDPELRLDTGHLPNSATAWAPLEDTTVCAVAERPHSRPDRRPQRANHSRTKAAFKDMLRRHGPDSPNARPTQRASPTFGPPSNASNGASPRPGEYAGRHRGH